MCWDSMLGSNVTPILATLGDDFSDNGLGTSCLYEGLKIQSPK